MKANELSLAIESMRNGVQVILRQIDESRDDRGAAKPSLMRQRARKAKAEPVTTQGQSEGQGGVRRGVGARLVAFAG